MLNFGFSLFKHDDNFCQLLHGWIHLGRSFLRAKPLSSWQIKKKKYTSTRRELEFATADGA